VTTPSPKNTPATPSTPMVPRTEHSSGRGPTRSPTRYAHTRAPTPHTRPHTPTRLHKRPHTAPCLGLVVGNCGANASDRLRVWRQKVAGTAARWRLIRVPNDWAGKSPHP
jgi:hypothetical protein